MEDQVTRDTRGYIGEALHALEKAGTLQGRELYRFLEEFLVPARIGDRFFQLIADEIRTHEWKTEHVRGFVEKNSKNLSDSQLILWCCRKGGYYVMKGVLDRAAGIWK